MISKNKRGILWSFTDRLSSQVVSFFIGIVLSRLLTPENYGTVGLLTVFIALSNVFVESGFSNALIRKLDRNEDDCTTAFILNVVIGLALYCILWITASFIAAFFNTPVLIPLLHIIALNVFLNSLCIVQRALLTAKLNIKIQTKISLASQIPAGIVAICCAYKGLGVYSLAVQSVGYAALSTFFLWFFAKWRPKGHFRKDSFKYLFGFGSKLVTATFIGVLFDQAYTFVIGKFTNKKQLGYYSKANSLAIQPNSIMTGVIQKVVVPIFSKCQDDIPQLQVMYRKYIRFIYFCFIPIGAIFMLAAKPIVLILWGEQWLSCVGIFQVLIFIYCLSPLNNINLCLLQVLGRTDYTLKLEFVKKPLYACTIAIAIPFGIKGILISQLINAIIANVVNAFPTRKFIKYGYMHQVSDVMRYIIFAYIPAIIIFISTDYFFDNIYILGLLNTFLLIFFYVGMLYLTKDSSLKMVIAFLFKKIN
jgi:teichuronic acid exporter